MKRSYSFMDLPAWGPTKARTILTFAAVLITAASVSARAVDISGAGATYPYVVYAKWAEAFKKATGNTVNYQSIGSGAGQKQIMAQTVDFGASDATMSDENLAKAPGKILHIPTVAGAVVITYKLRDNPSLKLNGAVLADIFLGKISKWNDKQIAELNPAVKLPGTDLVVVHRSDGSGTSYIFTDYLSSVSKDWESRVGRNTSVKWPAGLGAKGNEGVAGQVKQLPGAIGYVELAYAQQNTLPIAEIKNSAGNFIKPSLESITEALGSAKIPDDFRFSMVNPAGDKAYPIAGATWLLVYEQQKDAAKGKKLVEFLNWALTKGEGLASGLDYAPLPDALEQRVLERIKAIKY